MKSIHKVLALILLATAGGLTSPVLIFGQEATPTTTPAASPTPVGTAIASPTPTASESQFFVSDDILEINYGAPSRPVTLAETLQSLTAVADGEECVTISLTGPANRGTRPANVTIPEGYRTANPFRSTGKILTVGSQGQPGACRKAGARVTFISAIGGPAVQEFTLEPGTAYEITSLGIAPPSTGPDDLRPPSVGSSGLLARDSADDARHSRVLGGTLIGAAAALGATLTWLRLRQRNAQRDGLD